MSRTLVLVFCLFVGLNCQSPRIRKPGEIVPTCVQKSDDTAETGCVNGTAAIDLDFETFALATASNGSSAWIKLKFDKLYCISLVIRFNRDTSIRHSYVCKNAGCNCTGANCQFLREIIINSDGEVPSTLSDTPQCKYGNWVKLQVKSHTSIPSFSELAVFGTVVCPAGSYRISEEECKSCPDDEYSEAGAATCTKCPPGADANENRTGCEMCKAGTVKSSNMVQCADCSGNSVSAIGAASCVLCSPGTMANENRTLCVPETPANKNETIRCGDLFDHGIIPEPILWGLLGLFVLTSATLAILLARKCNSDTAEDEHGYINHQPTPLTLTPLRNDLKPAPKDNNATLKKYGDATVTRPSNEDAALNPRPTSKYLQVPADLPPAPASAVPESPDNLEPDYINMNSMPIYEEFD